MKEKTSIHLIVIFIISLACAGLAAESIMENWEFWVPPLLIVGIISVWLFHITQYREESFREKIYLLLGVGGIFFHGVHGTSFFDVAVIVMLAMVTYSLFREINYLNIILGEYLIIQGLQIFMAVTHKTIVFNGLNISRVCLHMFSVCSVYFVCKQITGISDEANIALQKREDEKISEEEDMEDFLVNISHELRTPVNVINGMSTLLLKSSDEEEVESIRDAGMRLSYQIEDIQDYTEIKRKDVRVEEEKYMITSLINDVISGYNIQEKQSKLDFVIDLDPAVPNLMKGDIKKLHKILRHLVSNALKFTKKGGVYLRVNAIKRDYGVNLNLEVTDTGIGMTRKEILNSSKGLYQANKKRNRSTGGIGLGLNIVYGFVHKMNGFVQIDSEKGKGTTVRISIPQEVIDFSPCLSIESTAVKNIVFHENTEKFDVPRVREFYRSMAINMAKGLNVKLYSATNISDLKAIMEKIEVSHIFMGKEEYEANSKYFDDLARGGLFVTVSAPMGYRVNSESHVIVMPKPLYGFPVVSILNGESGSEMLIGEYDDNRPRFTGIKALIVDDEPMNLVVAGGLFKEYGMLIDTASGGREAIYKFNSSEYDVIFMDHMMPEMDGIEAMKRIRQLEKQQGKEVVIIALTANAVSGAREMFLQEGFDGFISKPINMKDFERVMKRVLPAAVLRVAEGRLS